MRLILSRDTLLRPLQAVQGVVERRQSLPILANVLLRVEAGRLSVTATDMELELVAIADAPEGEEGSVTVPARKLVDICRALPADAQVELAAEGERVLLRSGRSRFSLATLPAEDFPGFEVSEGESSVEVPQKDLKRLIDLTQFAMAHQDVRYYLNGLLLEISSSGLRGVATDGHRLAIADFEKDGLGSAEGARGIIVPRKGVIELGRLLGGGDGTVEIVVGENQIRMSVGDTRFASKLVDGKFPDYERVIPRAEDCDKVVLADRDALRQSLVRASILSNDKYRAIRLSLDKGLVRLMASNPEQEQAEDEVEVDYDGESLEIGFNVSYLIEALTTLPSGRARLYLTDSNSSCLITPEDDLSCRYVVMPMRL